MATNFKIDCEYCDPTPDGLFKADKPNHLSESDWEAVWNQVALQISSMECPGCGGIFKMNTATFMGRDNITPPGITSIDVTTGPAAGGTTVNITGHGLNVGTLSVKFGDVTATINSSTLTTAEVVSPAMDMEDTDFKMVDISVSNEYGVRSGGGSLLQEAFTYTA